MPVRRVHDFTPDGAAHLGRVEVGVGRDDAIDLGDQLAEDLELLAGGCHLLVALAGGGAGHQRIPLEDLRHHAHELGVVGDDQEVERRTDLDAGAVVGVDDRETLGEAIGGVGVRRAVLHQEGVRRVGGVKVRIAPVQASTGVGLRECGFGSVPRGGGRHRLRLGGLGGGLLLNGRIAGREQESDGCDGQ